VKNDKGTTSEGTSELRRRAEERLKLSSARIASVGEEELDRLLHHLAVHEIELEIQNEELMAARLETEAGLARYTELFDFAPIGYVTLGSDGKIRELNHAAARLLGSNRRHLVGQVLSQRVVVQDLPTLDALFTGARSAEGSPAHEVRIRQPDGQVLDVRLTAAVPESGSYFLMALVDITEAKRRETELARAQSELRENDRRKDEFLAVLSHELRNPLASIRSSLFVLTKADPGSPPSRSSLAIIDRQLTHLTRLVDDLLDATRITQGKVRLAVEQVEVGALVHKLVADHRPLLEADGLQLLVQIEPATFWVEGDPARLTQALGNLLGNAAKFTPRGGVVSVSVKREDQQVAVRVRDTGAGIAPSVMAHVFEPFRQAPQAIDRSQGGLGLGLATVKGLVELHRGSVAIASEGPGQGTELTVTLPLKAPPAVTAPVEESVEVAPRRVMVIEDNIDNAESLRDALSFSGYEVCVAHNGPDALAAAGGFHPDVIICDIGLPGMDGYEVARTLRKDRSFDAVHLVALSGYTQPGDREKATAAGFIRHVAKPVRLEALDRLFAGLPARH
jgi:two-component system CheB/CheR fusion protein